MSDGSTVQYEGEFKAGARHGRGTLIWHGGREHAAGARGHVCAYTGEWRHGQRTGHGSYSCNGELIYEGRFWRGHWISLNWQHLRWWRNAFLTNVVAPAMDLGVVCAIAVLGLCVLYVLVSPAPSAG